MNSPDSSNPPSTDTPSPGDVPARRQRLAEIALLFARLGFTAFGGPAAHIAMMEDEVVKRRQWLSREQFLDLVAALNFIPGPNSTELAIHLGLIRGGLAGLVVAGVCFITPAVLIILPIAWMYVRYAGVGVQPPAAVLGALQGIGAVVVAILAVAAWRFAPAALKNSRTIAIAAATLPAELLLRTYTLLQPEIVILALAALLGAIPQRPASPATAAATLSLLPPAAWGSGLTAAVGQWGGALPTFLAAAGQPEFIRLAWFFLKVGATMFGSGYVLVSYLDSGLVEQLGWLTHRQVADAVAVGQVTPGPLLTTATFAGYLRGYALTGSDLGGVLGGIVATVGVFLPAFLLVAIFGRMLPRLRERRWARGALDAMNAAVVMLLGIVTARFAFAAVTHHSGVMPVWLTAVVIVGGLLLMLRTKVNSTVIIIGGASVGWMAATAG